MKNESRVTARVPGWCEKHEEWKVLALFSSVFIDRNLVSDQLR